MWVSEPGGGDRTLATHPPTYMHTTHIITTVVSSQPTHGLCFAAVGGTGPALPALAAGSASQCCKEMREGLGHCLAPTQ